MPTLGATPYTHVRCFSVSWRNPKLILKLSQMERIQKGKEFSFILAGATSSAGQIDVLRPKRRRALEASMRPIAAISEAGKPVSSFIAEKLDPRIR